MVSNRSHSRFHLIGVSGPSLTICDGCGSFLSENASEKSISRARARVDTASSLLNESNIC
jgi:hypothetical protein